MNIRIASLRVRLLLLVGLSFYWPMLTSCKLRIKAYAISDYDATVYVLVYFAAVALLGVAFAVVKGAGHWLAMHGKAGVALGACASLALLPGVFAPSTPVLGVLLVAPSIFLAALSFCTCTVGWGVAVLSPVYADNRKTFLVDVAITFFLGYALPIFLLDLSPTSTRRLSPRPWGPWVLLSAARASPWCWAAKRRARSCGRGRLPIRMGTCRRPHPLWPSPRLSWCAARLLACSAARPR